MMCGDGWVAMLRGKRTGILAERPAACFDASPPIKCPGRQRRCAGAVGTRTLVGTGRFGVDDCPNLVIEGITFSTSSAHHTTTGIMGVTLNACTLRQGVVESFNFAIYTDSYGSNRNS